jgi:hypothetical protein
VEQPPLNGSKISLLIKTTDDKTPILFHSLRLTEEEAKGKNSYEQTRMLFDKYQQLIAGTDMTMERNLVRTWIYVTHIDVNYQGVVEARNDVFDQQGLTAETHYYITRGRVGERKREKDAEERNNKITVELQLRKRQQEERDKKMI